jgi:hypothetical protein
MTFLSPNSGASVHARFQHGAKVVGASGSDPGFELPANFFGSSGIADRVVNLDLHKLLGMAGGAFNSHLRPVWHNLFLLLFFSLLSHRLASLLPCCPSII